MWPSKVPENKVETPNPEVKPTDKSVAEQIAEALQPFTTSFKEFSDGLTQRLATVEEQTRKPAPVEHPEPGTPTSVLDNEDVAFAQRLTPLMARQLELESRLVKQDIKAEYIAAGYNDLWNKFHKEIDEMVDKSPLVTADGKPLRGDPQYIRNVVDMIMGRAARAAGMRFDGKDRGFFLESASGGDDRTSGPEVDGMTEAQRKLTSRMGVPLDKAKDLIKNKLTFVH
jgi:hypothetical protein